MLHIVTPGFVDIPRWSDCTAGQIDGEAGWWTTSGRSDSPPPPLARVMGVGRQQQPPGGNVLEYWSSYGSVCGEYCFICFPHVVDVTAWSICIVLPAFLVYIRWKLCILVVYMFVVCEFWV